MRSIKILTALCIAAMFTSCAKDEYVAQDSAIQNTDQINAEVLGTNLYVDFGKDAMTKVSADGKWQLTDKLGLAWLVNTSVDNGTVVYDQVNTPTSNKLYANHLFYKESLDSDFLTKGNVYKGWHFAYYPYKYEASVASTKTVVVNPKQTQTFDLDVRNSALYLSARANLNNTYLNDDNKLEGIAFDMFPAFNVIAAKVVPSADFTGHNDLKGLKINKIHVEVGANVFVEETSTSVTLHPELLPVMQNDPTTQKYSEELTKTAVYGALNDVLEAGAMANTVSTYIDNANINLSEAQTLRIFAKPAGTATDLNDANMQVRIDVDGGYFLVKKVVTTTLTGDVKAAAEKNNAALAAIKAAYAANGKMLSYGKRLDLEFALTPGIFYPDFTSITSKDEWNNAVKVVNALGLPVTGGDPVVFNVDGKVIIDSQDALIYPNKAYSVTTTGEGEIVVATSYNMDDNLNKALDGSDKVTVTTEGTLNVKAEQVIKAEVNNGGVIVLAKLSKLEKVNNVNGRINVQYGSFVTTTSNNRGIIAYVATGDDKAEEINNLIRVDDPSDPNYTNYNGYVTVNTFVINEGITFDLSKFDPAVNGDDPYTGQTGSNTYINNMADKTIEMNGGVLKANAGLATDAGKAKPIKVGTIKILAGENTISNVNADELEVAAGKVTVNAAVGTNGIKNDIKIGEIDNKATLVANTDIYTKTIKNPKGASTTIVDGAGIWYTGSYTQGGVADGIIDDVPEDVLTYGVITVSSGDAFTKNIADNKYINLAANITIAGNQEVNGKVIDGKGYGVSTSNAVTNGLGKAVFVVPDGGNATIKNVTFTAHNTQYDIYASKSAVLTVEGCMFITPTDANLKNNQGNYAGKRGIYMNNFSGTLNCSDCYYDDKVYAFNVNGGDKDQAIVNFKNCNLNGWMSGTVKTFKFVDCSFDKSGNNAGFCSYAQNTIFEGCTFASEFGISVLKTQSFVFDSNCKYGTTYVNTPYDVKWTFDGASGAASDLVQGARTVKIGTDTYLSNSLEFDGTITWVKQ